MHSPEAQALEFAFVAHDGLVDKAGLPQILHPTELAIEASVLP